jgi:hypothetical protein
LLRVYTILAFQKEAAFNRHFNDTSAPMILIDNCLTDLVVGYQAIRQVERDLPRKWRGPLLAAYARRRQAFEQARARRRLRLKQLMIGLSLLAVLFCLGLSLGPIAALVTGTQATTLTCLGQLMALGATASVGVLMVAMGIVTTGGLRPPDHPLAPDQKAKLFLPLLPTWRERLRGQLPAEKPYDGAVGEYDLIDRLERMGAGFILYRLRQNQGRDDVDVTVVGPKGIWVFEVKYWAGKTTWRNGQWRREKTYFGPGRVPIVEPRDVGEPPNEQWRRMVHDIVETLHRNAGPLLRRLPGADDVQGGIVFTHPEATYDIARSSPFNWGDPMFWMRKLDQARPIRGLEELEGLELVEALLKRHRQVSGETAAVSMEAFANQLIRNAETRLQAWTQR